MKSVVQLSPFSDDPDPAEQIARMRHRRVRRQWVRGAGAAAAAAVLPARLAGATSPLRVGFVYVSPVTDAGWTYQHDLGRQAVRAEFGNRVSDQFVEKVAEGPAAERVITDLATQGVKLIFTTSFGFMEPTLRVARRFPELHFEHASGYKTAPNMGNYNARFYEGRYLAGMLSAQEVASGKFGYVAAFPIPEVVQGINAFILGAQRVNPAATVRVVWTQSWFDPGRERQAAGALFDQGVDLITHHTDSSAVVRAAEARSKAVIAYHSDMSKAAPTQLLASVTHHWDRYYVGRVKAALERRWQAGSYFGGLADGMIRLQRGPAARQAAAPVDAVREAIVAGSTHPFKGPIVDNAGRQRVAANQTLPEADIQTMNWYVQGVTGKVPG